MMVRILLMFLAVAWTTAAEPWSLQVAEADPVVRPGLIWRCRITGDIPATRFDDGPYLAQVSLTQGTVTLAAQEFPLAHLGQVLTGLDVVLVPGNPADPAAMVDVTVTVADAARRDLQHTARRLPTPLALQRTLEQQQRRLGELGPHDPLPQLWLEQAGELLFDGASLATCRQLGEIATRLDRWLAGERPRDALRALRDPLDDSVQPYRLHLPGDGPVQALAVLLMDHPAALRKSAWPATDRTWIAAAHRAHCAVVEVYPAGDQAWEGIGRARVWSVISAVRTAEPHLASLPLLLIGNGRGAGAALWLAEEHPLQVQGLGLSDARLPTPIAAPTDGHARWLALHRPGERPAHLLGTTVVVAGGDTGTSGWVERANRTGVPLVTKAGAISDDGFWRALMTPAPAPAHREWVVLEPAAFGALQVVELAEWGIAGSLIRDGDAVRTTGVARLQGASGLSVDGKPHVAPRASPPPRKALGQAQGPLCGYAMGPFTVVVGTGESAAALRENRALAEAFAAAWAAHAQARLPMVDDTGVDDTALPGRNLVLIGNTRSNLLLARLAARTALPVQWDARSLTSAGQTFLRAERRPVALAWPHPANDGRLLVILDGRPAWNTAGLPLAGLPDLVIGGADAGDPPALERTFGNDWR